MSMSHDQIIAVIAAHKEGKQIQRRVKKGAEWIDCDKPAWSFDVYDYRVKPEPREPRVIWVNEYASNCPWGMPSLSEKEARGYRGSDSIATRKFIEVIEEDEA